jgi:DNA-binding GntR family transcriptional regulator
MLAAHECHEHLVAALEHRNGDAARRALVSDIESAAAYILSLNQLPGTSNTDNGIKEACA